MKDVDQLGAFDGVFKALGVAIVESFGDFEVLQVLIPGGSGYIGVCSTDRRLILCRIREPRQWRVLATW